MRVGLISHSGRARDAVGNHLAEKAAFFMERGAEVRVFLQTRMCLHPGLEKCAEVVERAAPDGLAWEYLASADLVSVEYSQFYDLLHFLPLLAGGKARLVVDYHGVTPPDLWSGTNKESLQLGMARRGLVWCADAVIVHSRAMVQELRKATGFLEDRIISQALVIEPPPLTKSTVPSWRRGQELEHAFVALFVGRLAGNKRLPILVETLARLSQGQPAVHAVVVGDDGDLYADERRRCQDLAQRLGVAERVHFLGQLAAEELAAAYKSADVFVMPSLHEGFCVPVIEAMAHGLPVIAARAAALPETVADAGLTFHPDDAIDLADKIRLLRQPIPGIRKTLAEQAPRRTVAIVCFRFGSEIVGGAERSLLTIAQSLRRAGHGVEVFTTCTRAESAWANELTAGTFDESGLMVHRFPIGPHDPDRHMESVREIVEADGRVEARVETAYLKHGIHSSALIDGLRERQGEFDAIIVGPYLFGLTHDVARAFPEQTLLLPCFHDEPLARLSVWPRDYGAVGGIFYHSSEEQDYAQAVLGVNHPHACEIGAYLESAAEPPSEANAAFEAARVNGNTRASVTLVYCGRYSAQKDLPRLLEFAERYDALRPGRFQWKFMGRGEVSLPRRPWLTDLGQVDEKRKQDVLASAAALVQLSRHESLSLVVLEAWAAGTPVIVDRRCAVLDGQVRRSGGGVAVGDFEKFTRALDDLWNTPQVWQEMGQCGKAYVRQRYADEKTFVANIVNAIGGLSVPLRERMRQRGLLRAQKFTRGGWRQAFGKFVEGVLDGEPRAFVEDIEIRPYQTRWEVGAGTNSLLIPLALFNRGTHPASPDGAGRTALYCETTDQTTGVKVGATQTTNLPDLLMPGQTQAAALSLETPARPGDYLVRIWAMRAETTREQDAAKGLPINIEVRVVAGESPSNSGLAGPFLDMARAALAEAERLKRLPDDYVDITLGRFARWKRWLKAKLLGNFKKSYVDVLSRQQSQVNQKLMTAVQQLAECCATLDHALRAQHQKAEVARTLLTVQEQTGMSVPPEHEMREQTGIVCSTRPQGALGTIQGQ